MAEETQEESARARHLLILDRGLSGFRCLPEAATRKWFDVRAEPGDLRQDGSGAACPSGWSADAPT